MVNYQLFFLILTTAIGTVGALVIDPFCGLAIYYLFAVLRPQSMWEWSLSEDVRTLPWSQYVAAATLVALVLTKIGMLRTRYRQGREVFTTAHFWMFVFAGWLLVSFLTARLQDVSYNYLVEYAKIFTMYTAGMLIMRNQKQAWILFLIAALTVEYICYEVNAEYLTKRFVWIYSRGYGGLDNNGAGVMLAMGVPLCIFAWEGITRRYRWVVLLLVPAMIHAVLLTFSRGAMVALLAASPLILLRSRQRRYLIPLAVLLILMLLPVMAGKEIRQRFFSIEQYNKDRSVQGRFSSWKVAFEMAQDNPVFGVGIRNSSHFAHEYSLDARGREIHSQYLQIMADNGFTGLAIYLMVLFTAWRSCRRVQVATRGLDSPGARQAAAMASGVECSMAVFCVGAVFLSLESFELPYLLLLLAAELPALTGTDRHAVYHEAHDEVIPDKGEEEDWPAPLPSGSK